jgi:hypothetical protein
MMKSCAVGAMLFGGTLGATSAASAGATVTWDATSVFNFNAYNLNAVSDTVYALDNDPSVAALGSKFYASTSVTYTNTASSFSLSSNGGSAAYVSGQRFFTISGLASGETLNAIVTLGTLTGAGFQLQKYFEQPAGPYSSPSYVVQDQQFTAGTYTLALGNGSYAMTLMAGDWDTFAAGTISGFNGEFASFTVPAPGAIALLGAAGLMGRRRRN